MSYPHAHNQNHATDANAAVCAAARAARANSPYVGTTAAPVAFVLAVAARAGLIKADPTTPTPVPVPHTKEAVMFHPKTDSEKKASRRTKFLADEAVTRLNDAACAYDDPAEFTRRLAGAAEVLLEHVQITEGLFGRKVHSERTERPAGHWSNLAVLLPDDMSDDLIVLDDVLSDHVHTLVETHATANPAVRALVTAMRQYRDIARIFYVPGWRLGGDNSGLLYGSADTE